MSGLFLLASGCFAHPMGNFSINHYSKLKVKRDSVEVLYLIDMAEIPTFQEMRQFDLAPDAQSPNASRYLVSQQAALQKGLSFESDGRLIPLDSVSGHISFADGAGGLQTMKMAFLFRGNLGLAPIARKISYTDHNFDGRAGWKEIVVVADSGVKIVESSAASTDRSHELSSYSSDLLDSPPQQLSAVVRYQSEGGAADRASLISTPLVTAKAGEKPAPHQRSAAPTAHQMASANTPARQISRSSVTGVSAPATPKISATPSIPRPQNTPRSRFTELISTQERLSFWMLVSAALIAAGLGALHALEPGHGKTIVAAYLVGSRGTSGHAVLLGLVVTGSHMVGVYLLGIATLYASRYIVPEQLYPWLGGISGFSVAGLGVFLFLRHWTGESGDHSHEPDEQHSHWFLSMFQQPSSEREKPPSIKGKKANQSLSIRELCALGITGGIVPCPAALVVLLSAFSLHRIGFGLFLITAFSFGLASVLVIVGLGMVYAKRAMASRSFGESRVVRNLPLVSSAFMVTLGVGIAASALVSAPVWQSLPSSDKLLPFGTVILLGLFLGMRHSTDPDHVVAVATIVSRQGTIRSSATIGLLWGLGHTLTIFFVGSAIIIFGVVIPPRLGLSMEFCVAFMLILLGALNLSGLMNWLTSRSTQAKNISESFIATPKIEQSLQHPSRLSRFRKGTLGTLGLYQTLRPFIIGLVHGLAGSAAVALLVLSTIKSPLWSTAYLLVFGFGTMLGMMLMTTAMSMPMVFTGRRFFQINRYLVAASGVASMAFGIFLVYQIGFVDGLFTSQVHWTPQ